MNVLHALTEGSNSLLGWLWVFLTVDMTRGLLVFLLAWLLARLLPGISGRLGHGVWLLVIGCLVALPLARLLAPPVSFQTATAVVGRIVEQPSAIAESVERVPVGAAAHLGQPGAMGPVVAALWLLGFLFCVLRAVMGRVVVRRCAAQARKVKPGLLQEVKERLGVRRRVEVLMSGRCAVPFTHGLVRPRIILPASCRSWDAEHLRAVLTHELSHVKRMDAAWNLLATLVCSLLWFLPQGWIAFSLMQKEAEESCDREVLGRGIRRTDYAEAILHLSLETRGRILIPGTYSFTGRKNMLKGRIRSILSWKGAPAGLKRTGKVLVFCSALLLPLLAVTCSAKGEKLHGTWINTGTGNYKYTYNADGTGSYDNRDGTIHSSCRFVIEKKWMDGEGNTWYNVKLRWHSGEWQETGIETFYALMKIDPSGDTYEGDGSRYDYPKTFYGAAGEGHALFKRAR